MKEVLIFLAFAALMLVGIGLMATYGATGFLVAFALFLVAIAVFGVRQKKNAQRRLATLVQAARGDDDAIKDIADGRF
jgi:hypothetical protein